MKVCLRSTQTLRNLSPSPQSQVAGSPRPPRRTQRVGLGKGKSSSLDERTPAAAEARDGAVQIEGSQEHLLHGETQSLISPYLAPKTLEISFLSSVQTIGRAFSVETDKLTR